MSFIKRFFKNRKLKSLDKKISALRLHALEYQRAGKLREFGEVSKEIESVEAEYIALHSE